MVVGAGEKLLVVGALWTSGWTAPRAYLEVARAEKSNCHMLEPVGMSEIHAQAQKGRHLPRASSIHEDMFSSAVARYFTTGISIGLPFQFSLIQS